MSEATANHIYLVTWSFLTYQIWGLIHISYFPSFKYCGVTVTQSGRDRHMNSNGSPVWDPLWCSIGHLDWSSIPTYRNTGRFIYVYPAADFHKGSACERRAQKRYSRNSSGMNEWRRQAVLTLEQFLLMRNTAGFGLTQAWVHISAPRLASES